MFAGLPERVEAPRFVEQCHRVLAANPSYVLRIYRARKYTYIMDEAAAMHCVLVCFSLTLPR